MSRYLPVLWFVVATAAVLFLAGLGAAGNVKGALRYMRVWATHVGAMFVVAVVIALIVG